MLTEMAQMSVDDGLVMQIHPGVHRDHSSAVFNAHGQDKGFDIPFAVEYDTAAVQEGALYSIGARINDGAGNLLFVSTTTNPVITQGNPTEGVEILVQPVQ